MNKFLIIVTEQRGGMIVSQYPAHAVGTGPFTADDIDFFNLDWDEFEDCTPEEVEEEIERVRREIPDCGERTSLLAELTEARQERQFMSEAFEAARKAAKQMRIEEAKALLAEVDEMFEDPADAQRKGF